MAAIYLMQIVNKNYIFIRMNINFIMKSDTNAPIDADIYGACTCMYALIFLVM